MKTHTITVELTDDQCQRLLDEGWLEPGSYKDLGTQTYARFASAVREQWTKPSPQVGDVVRHRGGGWTREVVAVAGGWVYLSPGSDGGGHPGYCRLPTFHDIYEVVS